MELLSHVDGFDAGGKVCTGPGGGGGKGWRKGHALGRVVGNTFAA
jgi:hypothetical protein